MAFRPCWVQALPPNAFTTDRQLLWKVILEWQFAGKTEVRGGKPIQHIFTERPVPVLSGLMLAFMYPYSFHRGVGIHATNGDEG